MGVMGAVTAIVTATVIPGRAQARATGALATVIEPVIMTGVGIDAILGTRAGSPGTTIRAIGTPSTTTATMLSTAAIRINGIIVASVIVAVLADAGVHRQHGPHAAC